MDSPLKTMGEKRLKLFRRGRPRSMRGHLQKRFPEELFAHRGCQAPGGALASPKPYWLERES